MFRASADSSRSPTHPVARSFSLFVYGTLQPGEENYDRYCKKWVTQVQAATVRGRLFDLPLGYPALTAGDNLVHGFLLSFGDPAVLALLDDLEDYDPDRSPNQNEYLRVRTQALSPAGQRLGQVWIYQMQPERVAHARGLWLPDGKWSNQSSSYQSQS